MMKCNEQDRQEVVILSAAKDLGPRRVRFFAALRMTGLSAATDPLVDLER